MHITQTTKNHWPEDVVDRQRYNCVWHFCLYPYGLSLYGWHALICIGNNRHGVTITTHAIKRHFLIWMPTVRQPTKRRRSRVLTLKYNFICVYWWTRQRINNTFIVVDRYLWLMGDKTIPDSAEPRLKSFYPPFVEGIDLPHQGVVDSYNLHNGISYTGKMTSLNWIRAQLFQFNSSSAFVKFTGKRIIYVVSYVVNDDEVSVTDTWAVCSKHVQANINEITIDLLHLSFVKGMQRWPMDFHHKGSILPEALPRYDIIFRITIVLHVLENIPAWHSRNYHGLLWNLCYMTRTSLLLCR